MATKKANPSAKMEKMDKMADKKKGIKESASEDTMDKRMMMGMKNGGVVKSKKGGK